MSKLIGLICGITLLLAFADPRSDQLSKYKAVEAYEVRPGFLAMPRYSADGHFCKVAIQRDHYFNGVVDDDSTLPREAVIQIFDELAPPVERGPFTIDKEFEGLTSYGGNIATTSFDYKNVSLHISRPDSSGGDVVALITWKNRVCK